MGKTIGHKNPIIQLARLMYEKGKWDKAEKFYKKAYETETDWKQKVAILTNLGVVHRQREQLEKALSYYEQALEVGRNYTNDEYDPIFSGVFNNIGLIYCKKKDFLPAIENMQRALKIEETIPERTQEHIASIYLNIGFIFLEQHNYEQSFENLQHSLDIFLQIFPSETNGQIAMLYDNMARCFAGITNWSKAIEYAQKAVDIDIQLLPYEHDHAKRHRDNLEAYRKKKEEWQRHKFSKYLFYLAQILKKIFVFILNMKLY
jgi:tetratricopeptide (TPR) repeat protein